jgi:DNA-binding HxlR family transcriptional regulator
MQFNAYDGPMAKQLGKDSACSIARSLEIIGDAWSLLIVREAIVSGSTRFQEFKDALGVAPNILTTRLAKLVSDGVFERRSYQEPGSRSRDHYVLTERGRSLSLVVAALAEWGRTARPRTDGTSPVFTDSETGELAQLAFVTPSGRSTPPARLQARRTADDELPSVSRA